MNDCICDACIRNEPERVARQLRERLARDNNERDTANAEIERLHSWDGLMELLDEHYPIDMIQDTSGDPGSRICALIREMDELRDRLVGATELLHEQATALRLAREALIETVNAVQIEYANSQPLHAGMLKGADDRMREAISVIDAILDGSDINVYTCL